MSKGVAGDPIHPTRELGMLLVAARRPGLWEETVPKAVPKELLGDSGHHRVFINHHRQDGVGQLHGESRAGRNSSAWKN